MTLTPLRIDGDRFIDGQGRQVMLRGVNLGGDCKLPIVNGETWRNDDFSAHREVSFVGRPFPLDEAAAHFGRLRDWGFNCLRLLTTWEAVEHAGLGQYDEEYLDYFSEICRLAGDYDFYIFIDFHQDVWSRMTGGSGAPGWTLELVGLDVQRLEDAGAALTMQRAFDADNPDPHQSTYPQMCWSSNYGLAANGIMWTLFFGGRHVVPDFVVGGRNVQDVLQGAYLDCVREIARRVSHLPHVIGFDTLNEPSVGWLDRGLEEYAQRFRRPGPAISPLCGLAAASGYTVAIPVFEMGREAPSQEILLNRDGVSIWQEGVVCPFASAGIYRVDEGIPIGLKPDAFKRTASGARLDVATDCYGDFFAKVAATMRKHNEAWLLFAEIEPTGPLRGHHFPAHMPPGSVNASHWYDIPTLFFKHLDVDQYFNPLNGVLATGEKQVTEVFRAGLEQRQRAAEIWGGAPSLIGEFGIPFDLDRGAAYAAWIVGDRDHAFDPHEQALGMMYDALDQLLLNATIWNYSASNRNDPRIGDGWNQEDLSIYSIDQSDGHDGGGRAVRGFARPFVRAAQGRIAAVAFNRTTGEFVADIDIDPRVNAATELVLPKALFGAKPSVTADGASIDVCEGVAWVSTGAAGRIRIVCRP